ncbi:MAG: baseplate J/gp47 family protein [Candidatus Methylumidiphilus sp.]
MPFLRPTRAELLSRVAADFNAWLPSVDAALRRSVVGVLSRVHGLAVDGQYAYLDWIAKQVIPTMADEEMLLEWARLFLPVPRIDATFAQGEAVVAGTVGATIPAGTVFRRADGALFTVDAEATFSTNLLTVILSAQVAGTAGNTAESALLTLISPIAGVQNVASVSNSGVVGGSDIETKASVLARLQRRIQTPPLAGNGNDYVNWAFDAHPGVTRAWCFPRENGPGSVTVRFACDSTYAGGIPLSGDVDIVETYINAQRPVTGECIVVAPVAAPLAFEIAGLAPNTVAMKAAIVASLTDLIRKESTPGGNYWNGYTTQAGGTLLLSHLREAISATAGLNDFTLLSPSANVTASVGHLHTMGAVTWS